MRTKINLAQLLNDFNTVCDYHGFDVPYRIQIWSYIGRSVRAAAAYRAIANSLEPRA